MDAGIARLTDMHIYASSFVTHTPIQTAPSSHDTIRFWQTEQTRKTRISPWVDKQFNLEGGSSQCLMTREWRPMGWSFATYFLYSLSGSLYKPLREVDCINT